MAKAVARVAEKEKPFATARALRRSQSVKGARQRSQAPAPGAAGRSSRPPRVGVRMPAAVKSKETSLRLTAVAAIRADRPRRP